MNGGRVWETESDRRSYCITCNDRYFGGVSFAADKAPDAKPSVKTETKAEVKAEKKEAKKAPLKAK